MLFIKNTRACPLSAVHWQLLYKESRTTCLCLAIPVAIYRFFFLMFSSSYNSFNTCWECLLHNLLLHQASELCCVKNYLLKPDLNQVPQVSSTASWLSYSGSRWRAWRKWPKISVSPPTAEPQLRLPPLTEATRNGPCRGTRALQKPGAQLWAGYEKGRESR